MSVSFDRKPPYNIEDLLKIMEILRGEGGCPWDAEQTHTSIRNNFLEETYEVLDAIDSGDSGALEEELGDVLLQIVFHARMADEENRFDFGSVCDGICRKLIERHPHVFGDTAVSGSADVLKNWDKIKQRTKGQKTATDTLQSVPKAFPALMRSAKVQSRAAKAGFDYPDASWAMRDLQSEVVELQEAIAAGRQDQIDEELGDLLFSCVNVARFTGVDAEQSLAASCEKFISRFAQVEALAICQGIDMKTQSIEELDKLWELVKTQTLSQAELSGDSKF